MTDQVHVRIPTINTRLTLTRAWTFMLHNEGRNDNFAGRIGAATKVSKWAHQWDAESVPVTIPAGTVLIVDRIYIRKGKTWSGKSRSEYDSITFRIKKGECPDKTIYGRFWAKLGDVNRIVCEWDMETVKTDTKVDPITRLGGLVDPS